MDYTLFHKTGIIGSKIIRLSTCHSTNDQAFELIREVNIPEGTVVITDNQTAGKGQRGNSWEAQPGKNLTFSVLVKPDFLNPEQQFLLNIFSSLAVSEVVTQIFPKKIKIKWPNDIYAENQKISGILIQNIIRNNGISHSVIGIGLNVNQMSFNEARAVSIASLSGKVADLNQVLNKTLDLLNKFYSMLRNKQYNLLRKQYLENLYWMNEKHLFKAGEFFQGEICGIDENGKLQLISEGELRSFSFKEIEFIE